MQLFAFSCLLAGVYASREKPLKYSTPIAQAYHHGTGPDFNIYRTQNFSYTPKVGIPIQNAVPGYNNADVADIISDSYESFGSSGSDYDSQAYRYSNGQRKHQENSQPRRGTGPDSNIYRTQNFSYTPKVGIPIQNAVPKYNNADGIFASGPPQLVAHGNPVGAPMPRNISPQDKVRRDRRQSVEKDKSISQNQRKRVTGEAQPSVNQPNSNPAIPQPRNQGRRVEKHSPIGINTPRLNASSSSSFPTEKYQSDEPSMTRENKYPGIFADDSFKSASAKEAEKYYIVKKGAINKLEKTIPLQYQLQLLEMSPKNFCRVLLHFQPIRARVPECAHTFDFFEEPIIRMITSKYYKYDAITCDFRFEMANSLIDQYRSFEVTLGAELFTYCVLERPANFEDAKFLTVMRLDGEVIRQLSTSKSDLVTLVLDHYKIGSPIQNVVPGYNKQLIAPAESPKSTQQRHAPTNIALEKSSRKPADKSASQNQRKPPTRVQQPIQDPHYGKPISQLPQNQQKSVGREVEKLSPIGVHVRHHNANHHNANRPSSFPTEKYEPEEPSMSTKRNPLLPRENKYPDIFADDSFKSTSAKEAEKYYIVNKAAIDKLEKRKPLQYQLQLLEMSPKSFCRMLLHFQPIRAKVPECAHKFDFFEEPIVRSFSAKFKYRAFNCDFRFEMANSLVDQYRSFEVTLGPELFTYCVLERPANFGDANFLTVMRIDGNVVRQQMKSERKKDEVQRKKIEDEKKAKEEWENMHLVQEFRKHQYYYLSKDNARYVGKGASSLTKNGSINPNFFWDMIEKLVFDTSVFKQSPNFFHQHEQKILEDKFQRKVKETGHSVDIRTLSTLRDACTIIRSTFYNSKLREPFALHILPTPNPIPRDEALLIYETDNFNNQTYFGVVLPRRKVGDIVRVEAARCALGPDPNNDFITGQEIWLLCGVDRRMIYVFVKYVDPSFPVGWYLSVKDIFYINFKSSEGVRVKLQPLMELTLKGY